MNNEFYINPKLNRVLPMTTCLERAAVTQWPTSSNETSGNQRPVIHVFHGGSMILNL